MSQQEEAKQSDGKRRTEDVDHDDEKAAKKPRLPDASPDPPCDPFNEEILNGDREASVALRNAAKKKTDQADRWKKLFDEAQEDANQMKEQWAAAEVKAYRLVRQLCISWLNNSELPTHNCFVVAVLA